VEGWEEQYRERKRIKNIKERKKFKKEAR